MSDFVLVPGFWLGGWAWSRVAERLETYGHRAFGVTLTGLAERTHLASPDVTLETHVRDIEHLITYHELDRVVLVGHSGGGMPVSMVADRLGERVSRVVYVESGPLPEGTSQADTAGDRDRLLARAESEPDGWLMPFPDWDELGGPDGAFTAGLDEATRARVEWLATPQPVRTATDPVHYRVGDGPGPVPRTLITCAFGANDVRAMLAAGEPFFAGFLGEPPDVVEVPTGHWPMLSEPDALADALVAAAGDSADVGFGALFPMLTSSEPERLWSFYRSAFGAQQVYRFPQDAQDHATSYVSLRIGRSDLGIGRLEGGPGPEAGRGRIALWLYATDCDAATDRARAAGAQVVAEPEEQPWGERLAVVKDPDGNEVYIGQEL